jgi:hypothetical protein
MRRELQNLRTAKPSNCKTFELQNLLAEMTLLRREVKELQELLRECDTILIMLSAKGPRLVPKL